MIYWSLDWDRQAGAAEYQKSYDLDPTDANSAAALGNSLFFFHGESDTVLALIQKVIELDPVNSNCYVVIGGYYMLTGNLPEAETAFRKAIDLLPTDSSGHIGLGSVLLLRGEAAAALAYFALGRRAEAMRHCLK
jgi:Flp pilus assembly protein TadD